MCVCVSHPTNLAGPLVVHKLPMNPLCHLMQQLLAFVHPLLKFKRPLREKRWDFSAFGHFGVRAGQNEALPTVSERYGNGEVPMSLPGLQSLGPQHFAALEA